MTLTREQVAGAIECNVLVAPRTADVVVNGVVWDSREVACGCAFLAIAGERVDGNDFIPQAMEAGASMVMATREPEAHVIEAAAKADVAMVAVKDHLKAMGELASFNRAQLSCPVVGVSGSSGKTTTKNMIATVCSAQFETVATAANQNNELGVPNTVLRADPNTQALVVEMGMRGLGQLESLCSAVRPTIGVLTNIGTAHEELLGSRENIAKAKSELIAALPENTGIAVLNGDDRFTPKIREFASVDSRGVSTILYGQGENCDVRAENVEYSCDGMPSFDVRFPNGRTSHVRLPLAGEHNVMNALAAASVGFACDMPVEKICNALERAKGQAMRQEVLESGGIRVINDAYNANPDSMKAALSLLGMMQADGRKIAVLGDMGELGDDEAAAHENVGRRAAASGVDLLVTVGELARHIAAGARAEGMPESVVIECNDVASALATLEREAACGDVVLVKASRFMELERVVEELVDRC